MATGDLNRDNLQDIVVISPSSKELNVFLAANTPSRFAPARVSRFGDALRGLAIGDLNADNIPDVAVADQASNNIWILLGKGDGTFFTPYALAVGRHPVGVAIGNFDAVSGPDLAISDDRLDRVFVRLNDGGNPPQFRRGPELTPGEEPTQIFAVDMNRDGNPDIITLNLGGPRVKDIAIMLFNRVVQGFPEFNTPQKFTVGEKPTDMLIADFNNDDNPDVAMLNKPSGVSNNDIDVLLNNNAGILFPPQSVEVLCPFFTGGQPCRSLALAAGDFDDNGNLDLAVALSDPTRARGGASALSDALQAFSGRGDGAFVAGGVLAVQKNPVSMVATDVTGDGKPDIAIANQRTLSLQALINVSTPAELGNGEQCLLGDECVSARCTNGYCCASQCEPNEVCNVPGREGTCTPVGVPIIECEFPDDCDSGFCVDGVCCDDECIGGSCDVGGYEGLCIPDLPDGEPCGADDECASRFCSDNEVCCREACDGGYCDELGVCHALLEPGDECNVNDECTTSVCDVFDGICCNRVCNENTEFCNPDGRCERFDGATPTVTNTPNALTPGVTGASTSTPTPTPTVRSTPAPTGELCSVPSDCSSDFCVNGVCCGVAQCDANQHCAQGSGQCVAGGTPTVTATPTRTATIDECGVCPKGQECVITERGPVCISSSAGGGCSTGGGEAPLGGNLLVAMSMPLALWLGRRWQLKRAAVRVRSQRQ